jgi:hypothetical protein
VPVHVFFTPRADQQAGLLRRPQRGRVADFIGELKSQGCAALGYRLTGDVPLNHLCVRHLGANLRVVVAFKSPIEAWVLLVGPHDEGDPGLDVYTELYALVGQQPADSAARRKPPCCDEVGAAPVLSTVAEDLADRAVKLRQTRR